MAPTPQLRFEQALALLHHRHSTSTATSAHPHHQRSSPTQSSPSSSRRQIPQPHSSFQDALAMLHSGEHRHHSRDATQRALPPSTHRQNATTTTASGVSWPSPSQITREVQSRPTSSSTSIHVLRRSPQVKSSAPISPFHQALAMLQRGEHRTVTMPHVISHQQSMPSAHQETTAPLDRHAIMRRERPQLLLINSNIELRACSSSTSRLPIEESVELVTAAHTFREALARLHILEHQSHEAEAEVHDGRNRLQGAISRYPQETHSATQQVRSSGERPRVASITGTNVFHSPSPLSSRHGDAERHGRPTNNQVNARMIQANAVDMLVSHVDVSPNPTGAHGQHSTEAGSTITLANLPSLSFDEACDTITWRSARKLEILNCGICLDDFGGEDKVHLFPNCSHLFHVECVKDWLLKAGSCPCCRDVIINIGDPAQQ